MWYQGWNSTAWHSKAWGSKTEKKTWYSYWIGYAKESSDGSHWEKPLLDLYRYLTFSRPILSTEAKQNRRPLTSG